MAGFLATLFSILGDWHRIEFRRLRNSAVLIILTPLLFILPGAFLGGISWELKLSVLGLGMVIVSVELFWLAWRRLIIGAELGTVIELAYTTRPAEEIGLLRTPARGAELYIRLVAAILTSELAASLAAIWLPAHRDPVMALLLLPAIMIFTTYAIWQKGELWWPEFTQFIAAFTLVVSLVAILVPDIATELASRLERFQGGVISVIRGDPSTIGAFWVFGLLALLSLVAYRMGRLAEQPLIRIIAGMVLPILLIMLLIQYFVWGDGAKVIAKPPPAAALTRGARFDFRPELCPDPNFYRKLDAGEEVSFGLGNRPGCDVQTFNIQSGEAEVVLAYASGRYDSITWKGTDPGFQFKERVVGVSLKAKTPVIYRAY